jgi:alanyl-tRNA synthetase
LKKNKTKGNKLILQPIKNSQISKYQLNILKIVNNQQSIMQSKEVRNAFFEFFREKKHQIIPSGPIVVKNDPTLMFTNAGMNQFKDIFLGNREITSSRIADTQKCLRVSGKHNDLEEVGHDTYHHTMFEMLGNWSFGDYFKKEAIDWAWEFLTDRLKLEKTRLYATVFEGSEDERLDFDKEAYDHWLKWLPEDRILKGTRKDNFWEMGETGPCGPCSEIHIDLRSEAERKSVSGHSLVNTGNPLVIEIWNLVFIQFNRKTDGKLESLPHRHVDTGMGFERLCMAVQGKKSNYDTDVFQPVIHEISKLSGKKYGMEEKTDIAMRVIADHLRAVAFAIADGQIPSNNKAGYVIRRILRRAVRYAYTFLGQNDPFIFKLVPILATTMGEAFPELISQQELIAKVLKEEEQTFLRTLETGIRLLNQIIDASRKEKLTSISGKSAFELYDTFGFPLDLTELILRENNLTVIKEQFDAEMEKQKNRSRSDAAIDTSDWTELGVKEEGQFLGYDTTEVTVKITRYRKVTLKNKDFYQLIFNRTPFYAESGGQVGDTGRIEAASEKILILDTLKENDLIIHITDKLPSDPAVEFHASVDAGKQGLTANNHSATHLLHWALRRVLGPHVEQKGSLVNPHYLRFDFSHFQKLSDKELRNIEILVNQRVRLNLPLEEKRSVPIEEARKMGAMALFGEKYGDRVRVIKFGDSIELCGGIHVKSTGSIGFFKILSESAIAAGIRRIEAVTAVEAEKLIYEEMDTLEGVRRVLNNQNDVIGAIEKLNFEKDQLTKKMEEVEKEKLVIIKKDLLTKVQKQNGINIIIATVELSSAQLLKDLAFQIKTELDNHFVALAMELDGKANLALMVSETLVKEKSLNAGIIIREMAKEINGGGGGQPFFATAGGSEPAGIDAALAVAKKYVVG